MMAQKARGGAPFILQLLGRESRARRIDPRQGHEICRAAARGLHLNLEKLRLQNRCKCLTKSRNPRGEPRPRLARNAVEC